ncbi:geranylgeranylglycerol-phosphate geranylgeranyltransferase [Polaribacter aquimarinus]|uniref:Prenyltransferase n=1 Tax=Polaribacter aquimarinus TaxID=2100726 RepID=A0A2U2J7U7_9FLAO|nr:geranylgeranylglycerol-phosphate geranylgeranyltransferase [Polaribacter aquimarinus]PWG04361.1 prenyltransferase [Polaribacter aquimarinus]
MAFLKLIRYKNLLMVLLTMIFTKYALIHSFLKETYLSHLEFSLLALSVVLITAGGYIINDIYDIETDKINKPNKVFINVTISKKNAWKSYYLLTFFGLILGLYISKNHNFPINSFIFIFTIIGLFFYSKFFKKLPIIGNLMVSSFIWLMILQISIFEYIKVDNGHDFVSYINLHKNNSFRLSTVIYTFAFFAFQTTFIREIIKDIEDINGDLKLNAKTLPIVIGRKRASKVAFFSSGLLLIFLLIVLQFFQSDMLFLSYGIVLVLLPLLYFMYLLWTAENKKDFSKLSSLMKVIMLFGILSMLLFAIN